MERQLVMRIRRLFSNAHRSLLIGVTASVAIAWLILALGATAVAYNNSENPSCTWTNGTTVQVNWAWGASINTSGYWANGYRLASDAWTQAGTKVHVGYSSSAASQANVYSYANGLDGENDYWCHAPDIWNGMAYTYSYGNLYYNGDSSGYYTRIKQVTAHEFGHGLALGHSTDSTAVMCVSSCSDTPRSDDIAGLNSLYP